MSQRRRPRLSQRTSRKRVPVNDSISEEESADEESNLYLKKDWKRLLDLVKIGLCSVSDRSTLKEEE